MVWAELYSYGQNGGFLRYWDSYALMCSYKWGVGRACAKSEMIAARNASGVMRNCFVHDRLKISLTIGDYLCFRRESADFR
jgi:hypothetical protein